MIDEPKRWTGIIHLRNFEQRSKPRFEITRIIEPDRRQQRSRPVTMMLWSMVGMLMLILALGLAESLLMGSVIAATAMLISADLLYRRAVARERAARAESKRATIRTIKSTTLLAHYDALEAEFGCEHARTQALRTLLVTTLEAEGCEQEADSLRKRGSVGFRHDNVIPFARGVQ